MHRVLRVVPMRLDELRPVDALLAARSEEPLLLSTEVSEVTAPGAARENLGAERP